MTLEYPFRSVFLDTNIVRFLATLPGHFFDGGLDEWEANKLAGIGSRKLVRDIDVLQVLPALFRRGVPHALVITRDVVEELPRGPVRQYGLEFLDWCHAMGFVQDSSYHTFLDGVASALDRADRRLYLQAVVLGCDAFLTTDYRTIIRRRNRLPRGGPRVVGPGQWWEEIRPWAALFL